MPEINFTISARIGGDYHPDEIVGAVGDNLREALEEYAQLGDQAFVTRTSWISNTWSGAADIFIVDSVPSDE